MSKQIKSTLLISPDPTPKIRRAKLTFLSVIFFFLCFSGANAEEANRSDLFDPDYFATFSPQLKNRIRSEAYEVQKFYKFTNQHAMTVCSNYWIEKCRSFEETGKRCETDTTKTEAEFLAWLKHPTDLYAGISCLQALRWSRYEVSRHPSLYLHSD